LTKFLTNAMKKVSFLTKILFFALSASLIVGTSCSKDEAPPKKTTPDPDPDPIEGCTELFISEYIEGRGFDNAIELYNPTDAPINLEGYSMVRYSNGATTYDGAKKIELSGTIPAKGTYVLINNPVTEEDIDAKLKVKADYTSTSAYETNNTMWFNGNDAMVLFKGTTIIDIFGKVGEDPGVAWTDVFPYVGTGTWLTIDRALIRKDSVTEGVVANPEYFNALVQYDSLPRSNFWLKVPAADPDYNPSDKYIYADPFETLGSHDCICKD